MTDSASTAAATHADQLVEKMRTGPYGPVRFGSDRESALADLLALAKQGEALAEAADALVPFLDRNEVVPERERAALLNALAEMGLGRMRP